MKIIFTNRRKDKIEQVIFDIIFSMMLLTFRDVLRCKYHAVVKTKKKFD